MEIYHYEEGRIPMIKNYMEDAVNRVLEAMLPNLGDICTCAQCISDVKALALNNLKPKYVVTHQGEVYSKVNQLHIQSETDIIREITAACEVVKKRPRHDE
jgi:competence protein ComFB